jgi:hypothetical protein
MIHPELVAAALVAAGHFSRGASEWPLDAESFSSCSLNDDPIAASERDFSVFFNMALSKSAYVR